MSVILFSPDELGSVLAWYAERCGFPLDSGDGRETTAALASYSRANARAARATWRTAMALASVRACSAAEIRRAAGDAAVTPLRGLEERAIGTIRLMRYNTASSEREHARRGDLALVADLLTVALCTLENRLVRCA